MRSSIQALGAAAFLTASCATAETPTLPTIPAAPTTEEICRDGDVPYYESPDAPYVMQILYSDSKRAYSEWMDQCLHDENGNFVPGHNPANQITCFDFNSDGQPDGYLKDEYKPNKKTGGILSKCPQNEQGEPIPGLTTTYNGLLECFDTNGDGKADSTIENLRSWLL